MRQSRLFLLLLFLIGLVALGEVYGYLRAGIGLIMGAAIIYVGFSYFSSAALIPPEPESADVEASELRYVCTMCGLELKVQVATTDKPPTHCREPMVLVRGGTPPLRPVT